MQPKRSSEFSRFRNLTEIDVFPDFWQRLCPLVSWEKWSWASWRRDRRVAPPNQTGAHSGLIRPVLDLLHKTAQMVLLYPRGGGGDAGGHSGEVRVLLLGTCVLFLEGVHSLASAHGPPTPLLPILVSSSHFTLIVFSQFSLTILLRTLGLRYQSTFL